MIIPIIVIFCMNRVRQPRTLVGPRNLIASSRDISRQHEHFARIYQKSYRGALMASGIRGQIYSALTGGTKCTCFIQASILDDDGNLSPGAMGSILSGQSSSGRKTYKAMDLDLDLDAPDTYGDLTLADDDLANIGPEEYDTLEDINFGYGQNRCGVCFGVGYVGGYSIANGYRLVADTQANNTRTNFSVITAEQPNKFRYDTKSNADGEVVFTLSEIPKQSQRIMSARIWNNDRPLASGSYTLSYGGQSTLDTWLSGSSNDLTVSVSTRNDFTHLELQFAYNGEENEQWVDFPQIPSAMFEPDLLGQRVTATLNLPYDANVNNRTVVRESKFGRTWQISEANPHYDNGGIMAFVEAEARLVGQNEIFNLLPGI